MKKFRIIIPVFIILTLFFQGVYPASLYPGNSNNGLKTVYIKEFTPGPGIIERQEMENGEIYQRETDEKDKAGVESTLADFYETDIFMFTANTAYEIKIYMSEVVVQKKEYSLISESEALRKIESANDYKEKKAENPGRSKEAETDEYYHGEESELFELLGAEYIITGNVDIVNNEFVMQARLIEFDEDSGFSEIKKREVRFPKDIYVDRASRALAEWLLTEKPERRFLFFSYPDPVEKFYEDIERIERRVHEAVSSESEVDTSHFSRKHSLLVRSPLVRVGYGGFGKSSAGGFFPFGEKNQNLADTYDSGHEAMFDVFIYRSKDQDGNGVDLFVRGLFSTYEINGSGATDGFDGNEDNYIGVYSDPVESGRLMNYGGDFGFRFVRSSYYFYQAWSFYLSCAVRFMYVDEFYTLESGEDLNRDFFAWGFAGGAGFEVSLTPHTGIFSELNYGYTPVGDNRVNIDGLRWFAGVTFRTTHWRF